MKKIALACLQLIIPWLHACPAVASSLLANGHDAGAHKSFGKVEPSMHKTRVHRRENAMPEHTARISDAHSTTSHNHIKT